MIELYACMTPNVLKVIFMLGELELPYQLQRVRIFRGENFSEGFEKLHPYRKLPVLIDHDSGGGEPHTVFESGAILVYLAEKHRRFLGDNPLERSRTMQWLMLQMSSVGPTFGQASHFTKAAPQSDAYARKRFVTAAVRLCELYDDRLSQSEYLAGDALTIADIATFPWLWRHPGMNGIDTSGMHGLNRWIDAIRTRPRFQHAHQAYKRLVEADTADMKTAPAEVIDRFLGRGRWSAPNVD
jgi:GST-like protein